MPTCPCGRTFNQHPLDPRPCLLCPVCRNQIPWERAGQDVTWGVTWGEASRPSPASNLAPVPRPVPEAPPGCG